jgi:hypothetical protein
MVGKALFAFGLLLIVAGLISATQGNSTTRTGCARSPAFQK